MVLEFPPRLSFRSQVSTESLYGTNTCFFFKWLFNPSCDRSATNTKATEYTSNIFTVQKSLIPHLYSPKAEMTLPKVTSDLLILPPSLSRTPVAPVASARSLPARSTRWILLTVSLGISASNFACEDGKYCISFSGTPRVVLHVKSVLMLPAWS